MERSPKIEIWTDDWPEYELLDSGNYMRLERFGKITVSRSEPRAWWRPALPADEWGRAEAVFAREEKGVWELKPGAANQADLRFGPLTARLKLAGGSKHVGVFPEQSGQWRWIMERVRSAGRPVNMLSLFGYTGMATLAAASAGAQVTHVDGSKPALTWANENAKLSGLQDRPIRWILDDALKFVKREARRGRRYDAIVMDPPAFGRGPKGEVWKVEDSISALLDACRQVLSERPLFAFMTMYSIEASSLSLGNLLAQAAPGQGRVFQGELALAQKKTGRLLPLSIFAGWESRRLARGVKMA